MALFFRRRNSRQLSRLRIHRYEPRVRFEASQYDWPTLLAPWLDSSTFSGKHQPCPRCGGTDRFRWDQANNRAYCNGCGGPDGTGGTYSGLDLLVHVKRCSVAEAIQFAEGTNG